MYICDVKVHSKSLNLQRNSSMFILCREILAKENYLNVKGRQIFFKSYFKNNIHILISNKIKRQT